MFDNEVLIVFPYWGLLGEIYIMGTYYLSSFFTSITKDMWYITAFNSVFTVVIFIIKANNTLITKLIIIFWSILFFSYLDVVHDVVFFLVFLL